MQKLRRGECIQTYTGEAFWPLDPHPDEVNIIDIAHALSNLCRYGGHTLKFYSVAQHSYYVSKEVPPEHALCGLLHDATEAYLVDVPSPIKPYLSGYKDMENGLWKIIAEAFYLSPEIPDIVQEVDRRIVVDERNVLMAKSALPWDIITEPLGISIEAWPSGIAERAFLSRFRELTQ